MTSDDLLLHVFCLIDDELPALNLGRLRAAGPEPLLSDSEVITIEVVGEFGGLDTDKAILAHFGRYYHREFPNLRKVHRTTFARQAANLCWVKERLRQRLQEAIPAWGVYWLVDSVPLPVCQFARAPRCQRFRGQAAYGDDDLARQTFYGFRLPLRGGQSGAIAAFELAPANVSDLAMVEELAMDCQDVVLGDRNYWSPQERERLAPPGILWVASFRHASRDPAPQRSHGLGDLRRRVDTTIGQLCERYHLKRTWARDLWHLCHRLIRKVLSYTVALIINAWLGHPMTQLESLVSD